MRQHRVRPMADIVVNHRVGTTTGHGGIYNRFDGIALPWDEHAITSCTGGLVSHIVNHYICPKLITVSLSVLQNSCALTSLFCLFLKQCFYSSTTNNLILSHACLLQEL